MLIKLSTSVNKVLSRDLSKLCRKCPKTCNWIISLPCLFNHKLTKRNNQSVCNQVNENDKYTNFNTSNFALGIDVEIEIFEIATNLDRWLRHNTAFLIHCQSNFSLHLMVPDCCICVNVFSCQFHK